MTELNCLLGWLPARKNMTQTNAPYLILVGLDYSTASDLAFERALELAAERPNAELHVVHVVPAFDAAPSEYTQNDQIVDMPSVDSQAYEELKTYVAVSVGALEKKQNGTARKPVRVVSHLRVHEPDRTACL